MQLWHLTSDACRVPMCASAGEHVVLNIGTWPIERGQSVRVAYAVTHADGASEGGEAAAAWSHHAGANSYGHAGLGPFCDGDRVRYVLRSSSPAGAVAGPASIFMSGRSFASRCSGTSTSRGTGTVHRARRGTCQQV